jgi:gliding motility-associated-like protein
MKKLVVLAVMVFCCFTKNYGQEWRWSTQFKGLNLVTPVDAVVDNSNNVYVIGTYDVADLTVQGLTITNHGDRDGFICKFNSTGQIQWLKSMGGTDRDIPVSITIISNQLYIIGDFKSSPIYFTATDNLPLTNNFDSFLAVYDLNGNFIRSASLFYGNDIQRVKGMLYDSYLNNLVITGQFKVEFKYFDGTSVQTVLPKGSSGRDHFVVRTNLNGEVQDTVFFKTTSGNTIMKSIAQDQNTGYYISGDLFGTLNFTTSNFLVGNSTSTADAFVVKLDKNLDFLWARKGGGIGYDHVNSSVSDQYGNIYLAGKCESTITFDSTASIQSHSIDGFGAQDLYIAKYNKLGLLRWVRRKGDGGNDDAFGLAQRENLLQFCGNISGEVIFNEDTLRSSGLSDINTGFAILNTTGNEIGAQGVGGTGTDIGEIIKFSPNGFTIISGHFDSPLMDIGDSTYINTSGTADGFIAAYYYPMNAVFTTIQSIECHGDGNGRLIVTPYFGVGPYVYTWSPNVLSHNDSLASDLGPGLYSVTVTDALLHTASNSFNMTEPSAIDPGGVVTDVSCYPTDGTSNDGTINLTVTGGTVTGGYTYNWEALSGSGVNATSEDQTTLTKGIYSVTVADDNMCEASDTFTVGQPGQITFGLSTVSPEIPAFAGNGEIDLEVSGGNPSFLYAWTGPGGFSSGLEDITGLSGGNYNIHVQDSEFCGSDTTFVVSNASLLIAYISDKTDVDCKNNNTGSATVSVLHGTGSYTYLWKDYFNNTIDGSNPTVINLPDGIYYVTVTDNISGKSDSTTVQITEPAQALSSTILGSDITCFGENDGIADLSVTGGTLPYGFHWSNNASVEDLVDVSGGTYFITITDANGCTDNNSIELDEPPAMDLNISIDQQIQCYGDLTGRATATATGGTGSKSYIWDDPGNQNAQTATELGAGIYHVTATDITGCSIFGQVEIFEPDELMLSEVHNNVSCPGESDGRINLSVSGGTPTFNYDWSNGAISQDLDLLDTGTYAVVVTDAHNCVAELSVQIREPEPILFQSIVLTNASCAQYNDGSIEITAAGGDGSYEYSADGGLNYQTLNFFNGIGAGEYTLRISDGGDCESADSIVEITEPTGTTLVSADISNVTCFGYSDGSISITATSPAGGLTYSIDNGTSYMDNSGIFDYLGAGVYLLSIRDANGCEQAFGDLIIEQPDSIIIDTNVLNAEGDQNGRVTLVATGGSSPYNYHLYSESYDSTGSSGLFIDLLPGTYYTFITDDHQCTSDTLEFTILQTSTEIIIYDAFSPNNDGRNDVWNIGNIGLYPGCTVKIFNTWGNTVFTSKGYTEPWDGKYNGKELPAGTYYYIIDLGDGTDPLSGPVSIVR